MTERRARRTYGLCEVCGELLADVGHRTCGGCRAEGRDRVARLRAERRAEGVCVDCGDDAAGCWLCDACQRGREVRRRGRYVRKFERPARLYYCSGCGGAGHNVRSCTAPARGFWSADDEGPTNHV